jgi:hypothetical protein
MEHLSSAQQLPGDEQCMIGLARSYSLEKTGVAGGGAELSHMIWLDAGKHPMRQRQRGPRFLFRGFTAS